jgi:hypothetical protein
MYFPLRALFSGFGRALSYFALNDEPALPRCRVACRRAHIEACAPNSGIDLIAARSKEGSILFFETAKKNGRPSRVFPRS